MPGPSSPHVTPRRTSRVALAAAAAAVIIAGAVFYGKTAALAGLWRADRLLSQAYSEIRPFPFRLPGRGYRPVQPPAARTPSAIREARVLLARAAGRLGERASIHSLLGRASLLERSPDEAIDEYRRALDIDPRDAQARIELAGAYLLRAGQQDRPVDIALALEQLGTATGLHPESAEDHFNLALAYEAVPAPHLALEEWTLCLRTEGNTNWRREAEAHRARLAGLLTGIGRRAVALESPGAFLRESARRPYPPDFALDVAISDWLPRREQDAAARLALALLAGQFTERQDPWLADLLRADNPAAAPAIQALAIAIRDNQTGKHEIALRRAAEAEALFHAAGNRAGEFRARFENVYAFQRAEQHADCLPLARSLYKDLAQTPYSWLRAQAWLEVTSCELAQYLAPRAASEREAALEWIRKTGYESLELRALGFLADPRLVRANPVGLWRTVHSGLVRYWAGDFSPLRAQQFYYGAAASMRGGSFPFATAVMARENARAIDGVPNRQWQAFNVSGLGAMEMEAGLNADALASFRESQRILATCELTETARRYQLHDQVLRAAVECWRDDPRTAVRRLNPLSQTFSPAKSPEDYLSLQQSLGIALSRAGDSAGAMRALRAVMDRAPLILDGMRERRQRDAFLKTVDYTYREITEVKLVRGRDPQAAFESLERFRAARSSAPMPAVMTQAVPAGALFVDIAFLPAGAAAFATGGGRVASRWMPGMQAPLESWARQFTALCASPASSQAEIDRAGRRIYDLLIAPFERQLDGKSALLIQADGPLQNLPWAALKDARGRTLLDRLPVIAGELRNDPAAVRAAASSQMLLVAEPAIALELVDAFPPLSGALREARRIQSHFPQSRLLSGPEATIEAVKESLPHSAFFHFGGHGLVHGGYGAMLLASRTAQSYGGVLGAPELAGMDLHEVELISLAACSIGVGQSTGPVNPESLVRALLDAGAHRVIAAGWEIESQSAGAMFTDFYGKVAGGQRIADAMRAACMRIRSNLQTAHPYYWAGYQLYGSAN